MADVLGDAQTLYRESMDQMREQRQQVEEDLLFSDPSNPQQWDDQEKRQRETDPGGSRPCIVNDQCGQYVSNVAGAVEKQPPSIHVIPSGGGADRQVAEHMDGFFRHIEHVSGAAQHYMRSLTSAGRTGVGYLIVRPAFTDRAMGYQEPRIGSEGDPLRVVFDPWSVEIDGSDADFAFLMTPLSKALFERKYPKCEAVSFGDEDSGARGDDSRESVLLAEQWYKDETTVNMIKVGYPTGDEAALSEDDYWLAKKNGDELKVLGNYKDKKTQVWWRRMSGAEILEETKDSDGKVMPFPSDSIGIVPVYGYVSWRDGRMHYCGIPRRARQAQRSYNYHVSEARAFMTQAPKSPWVVAERSIRKFKSLWDRSSVESRAYLPYDDIDETGQAIAAPQRTPLSIDLHNHIAGADQAIRDIQAAIGMYQANLGAPSNEQSGVAIDARKAQGEASTAHFPAHLSASLGQVGRIVMDMVPRVIDTKRQLRIIGIDQTPTMVTLDPNQKEAIKQGNGSLSINPNVGKYDVRVVVGASFTTQRQQAQQAFTEMMRANPAMAPALAPLWAQTLDVPHADQLAQVLTAIAPEPVRAILQPNQQDTVASLNGKIAQMQQALQEAVKHAQDAQQDATDATQKLQGMIHDAHDKQEEHLLGWYSAETDRLKVTGAQEQQLAQIQADLARDMAATIPEPVEEAQEQPPEEPMEDPAMGELKAGQQALVEHHQALADRMEKMHQAIVGRRVRIPVRDAEGNLTHVIDQPAPPDEEASPQDPMAGESAPPESAPQEAPTE